MKQEYIDIFDENNISLNFRKTRQEVHQNNNYWHRATTIWIINKSGEILYQKRSIHKDSHPGELQSHFGGHLSSGETYDLNAGREIYEELGINIRPNDLIPLYIKKNVLKKHHTQVYVLVMNININKLKFHDGEVEFVDWINLDQLKEDINNNRFCNKFDEKVFEFINNYCKNKLSA